MSLSILVGLMLLGASAILLEIFVPSAGLLGLGGLASIVFAVVQAYRNYGLVVGTTFLTGAVVVVPILLFAALKLFPRSWVGRKLILQESQKRDRGYSSFTQTRYEALVGKEGESVTDLRPSGLVRLDGKKYSVVTSGEYIGKSERIRVMRTEGSRVVVARAESTTRQDAGEGES